VEIKGMEKSSMLRKRILEIIHRSNASHVGSSLSAVEILSAVYSSVDISKIIESRSDRDRVILSKGHSAAALYVVLNYYGLLSDEELETYHSNNSLLGGHATHNVKYVEHSTGALGHGLSVAVGIGIGLKSKKIESHVYAIVGDGELQEGSNWEALLLAGHHNLNNICVLVDNNGLSGIGATNNCCALDSLKRKFQAFRFQAFELDGHDEDAIYSTIQNTKELDKPVALVCSTVKGKGVSFMENNNVWHYRPPDGEACEKAIRELKREEER
jgi:transketolase